MRADGNLVLSRADAIGQHEQGTAGVHDTVINRIFGAGLMLAGVLSLEQVGEGVADRLRDAIDELDTAVGELRTAALAETVAGDVARAGADGPGLSRGNYEGEPCPRVPSTVAGFD